jgi:hypothetical protein
VHNKRNYYWNIIKHVNFFTVFTSSPFNFRFLLFYLLTDGYSNVPPFARQGLDKLKLKHNSDISGFAHPSSSASLVSQGSAASDVSFSSLSTSSSPPVPRSDTTLLNHLSTVKAKNSREIGNGKSPVKKKTTKSKVVSRIDPGTSQLVVRSSDETRTIDNPHKGRDELYSKSDNVTVLPDFGHDFSFM